MTTRRHQTPIPGRRLRRVTMTLPAPLVAELDALAELGDLTRSAVAARLLSDLLLQGDG